MLAQERYDELKDILCSFTGLNPKLFTSRQQPYPWMKYIIWLQMRNEGYPSTEIGPCANQDHSTVITQTTKLRHILKEQNPSWRSVIKVWEAFQQKVKNCPSRNDTSNDQNFILGQIVTLPRTEQISIYQRLKQIIFDNAK